MGDAVQDIKDRLNVVDVVGGYVKLTKAGKYHKGLCPFHKEKSPSFMVSGDRGFFHCFGCGKGGDVFSFIQEMERVDFRGALTMLAEKAGVTLERVSGNGRDQKEKVYAALEAANDFFKAAYREREDVQSYVASRGIGSDTVLSWQLGFAQHEWRALGEALEKDGFDEKILLDAGLIKHAEKEETVRERRPYDRFRGRIMFPLFDAQGRIVGFSGRAFGDDAASTQAKYLNSPETVVFDKSRLLYGLHKAKDGIRKYGFALLVEGQIDLLMAHQVGYSNTVATSGTAFTEHHATMLKRYADNLLIAYDGDSAGVAASGRAAFVALDAGLNVKIARLPQGADPADIIEKDPDQWRRAVKEALHVVDFYIEYVKDQGFDDRKFRLEVSRTVLPYVARIGNAIDRAHFTERVSMALKIPERAVEIELDKIRKKEFGSQVTNPRREIGKGAMSSDKGESGVEPFLSREDTLERLLVGVALSYDDAHEEEKTVLVNRIGTLAGESSVRRVTENPEEMRVALIESDLFFERHPGVGKETLIEELIQELVREKKKTEYRETVFLLKQAERDNNHDETKKLIEKISALTKEM